MNNDKVITFHVKNYFYADSHSFFELKDYPSLVQVLSYTDAITNILISKKPTKHLSDVVASRIIGKRSQH